MSTKVMIVEDQQMPRQLFEIIIEGSSNFTLVHSIESADMAMFYCEQSDIDLILMDVCTALDASGLEAAERIKAKYPKIKIIIVTSMPEFSWIDRAKRAGVESFWYKDAGKDTLIDIMNRTVAGESIYPDTAPVVQIGYTTNDNFSERELEILRELTSGDTNVEIAKKFGISPNTVRNHVQVILEKTGFKSRTELAVEARRLGIVILDK